jgi:hypothetical protein
VQEPGMDAGCTNPAALAGGRAPLRAYLSTGQHQWTSSKTTIATPFVAVPGLLSAECVSNDKGSYLEITVHGRPEDPRTDDIPGDVMANGKPNASWGLHLIDVHAALGDLVDIVGRQAQAWSARTR